MIYLPELNKKNWKKILREINIAEFPSLPNSLEDLRKKLIKKEPLGIAEEALGYARLFRYFDEFRKQINSIYIKTIDYKKFAVRPPLKHQIAGIEFLLKNNKCILGDDMGLGKSSTTIYSVLSMEDKHKVLIVTLKTLKYNFAKEISFFDKRFSIVDKKWEENKFTIVHYDALKKWEKEINAANFSVLILDEAHKCFTYDTLIETDKGKLKIGDIVTKKLDVKILSYNINSKKIEYNKINNYFTNPPKDTTLEIEYLLEQQYLKLECTSDHKIYVNNENRYKRACEFTGNEKILVLRKRTFKDIFYTLSEVEVISVNKKNIELQNVYDIEVNNNHNYFANNILVSNCRNAKSARSIVVTNFIKSNNLLKIWLLTGTPIDNRPIDYFHLLKLINHPLSKNWKNYVERYCDGRIDGWGRWQVNGHSNLKELYNLTQDTFLRRLKTSIAGLPEKSRRPLFLELKNKKGYNQAIEDGKQKRFDKLVDEVDFKGELNDIELEEMTKLMLYRQFCAIEKVKDDSLNEVIDSMLEENEENKIVVFTNFTTVVDSVYEHLGTDKCMMLDGRVLDPLKRILMVEEFNNNKDLKVLVCNLKVGGTGLNIQSANKVIMNDMDWVPANMIQAEDRCIFKGQEVLTKNGFINIENVNIGDYVYTHLGNFKKVINKTTRLERNKLKATIDYYGNNKPLEVTEDHELFVFDKKDENLKWLRADEVKPGRHYLSLRKSNISKNKLLEINIKNKVSKSFLNNFGIEQTNQRLKSLPEKIILSNDLLYAFGVYIAEGSSTIGLNSSSVVTISGNLNTEKEWINKNAEILSSNFNMSFSIEEKSEQTGITARLYSKELALLFIEWFGKGSHNKKLPDWIWECNEEQVKCLLNGYYDGDGHARKNSQNMVTVSSLLSSQLILLHSAINQPISIRKEKNTEFKTTSEHYRLEFNKIDGHRICQKDDYILFRIHSLNLKVPNKDNGADRTYDLEVEDDSSFVVGQANVHNCWRIGQKRDVEVIYLIYDDTVEVALYKTVDEKMKVISTIIEGKEEEYFEGSEKIPDTTKEDKKDLIKAILAQMGL